ncbi:MAG: RecQ family ATP-dependent DNA helicase [Vulcanimicrobiaceae bacterium]
MIRRLETVDRLEESLRELFGFSHFQSGQQEVIERVMRGEDTLAILATGAGKSLCYQLPALLLEGTTVVVSPLIALMKDQLDMLTERGFTDNVALNSTLSEDQEAAAVARIAAGSVKIVFVTPEKLEDEQFLAMLKTIAVPLFVVDEAHCISQWGHDFRPAYLALGQVIGALGHPTVLALTATATPAVREDILVQLGLPKTMTIVKGFDRPNLRYEVIRADSEAAKLKSLKALFEQGLEGTGIIYTATIKNALEVQKYLHDNLDLPAAVYHSKLQKHDRNSVHELFMGEAIRAVVATNAFGLGIDKPNIRFVVHYDLPGSVEAYTQEAGRAGRDGDLSRCILLYRMSDTRVQNYFLTGKYPSIEDVQKIFETLKYFGGQADGVSLADLRKISQLPLTKLKVVLALLKKARFIEMRARARYGLTEDALKNSELVLSLANYDTKKSYDQSKLAMMLQYCETRACRRRFILNYFGEEFTRENCGRCDNCTRAAAVTTVEPRVTSGYRIADVVSHPKFGQGTVERAEKDLVTVLFPSVGYKTLLASAVNREAKIA